MSNAPFNGKTFSLFSHCILKFRKQSKFTSRFYRLILYLISLLLTISPSMFVQESIYSQQILSAFNFADCVYKMETIPPYISAAKKQTNKQTSKQTNKNNNNNKTQTKKTKQKPSRGSKLVKCSNRFPKCWLT